MSIATTARPAARPAASSDSRPPDQPIDRPIERSATEAGIDALVRDLGVPPRPQMLEEIALEMSRPRPEPLRIARAVAHDVALTAAVLKLVNAPAAGLARRAQSLGQAVQMLGLERVMGMVAGLVRRKALR